MSIPVLPPPSQKAIEIGERVKAFLHEHIIPAEHTYHQQLDEGGDRWTVQLVMDVNKWFEAPNQFDFDVFGSDVMSNPTAQRELGENGVHVFHLGGIAPTP